MRVLIVSQHFRPESFRINEVADSLVANGIDLDVLTGQPNYPDGDIYPGYSASGQTEENLGGMRVFRVPLFPRGRKSGLRLAINYVSFIASASVFGTWRLREARPDAILVYATSPLLQALPALLLGWLKKVPVIIYVQDLWPESLEATGYVRNRLILGAVGAVVGFIYRRASLILVSSRPFETAIRRFSPKAEIVYYPNSVDASFCDPLSGPQPEIPALSNGFTVAFAGNIGSAQAVGTIVDAARLLREHSDIRIVMLGSGSEVGWIEQEKTKGGLDNLVLAGRFPSNTMPWLLSKASALLVTLSDQPIFAATVPNKIQAYMAVGRPIIACLNGEGARIVSEAGAGMCAAAEDSAGLAEAILALRDMPLTERARLGTNGQAYYRQNFDHETLVTQLIGHISRTIKKS